MLFADAEINWPVLLTAVGGLFTAIVAGCASAVAGIRKGRADARKVDIEADAEAEKEHAAADTRRRKADQQRQHDNADFVIHRQQDLIDNLTTKMTALESKVDVATQREARCQIRLAKVTTLLVEVCRRTGTPVPDDIRRETDSSDVELPPLNGGHHP